MNENSMGTGASGNKHLKMVYTIVDGKKDGKSFWVKIGVGTVNRDGSLNLRLDALPVNGTMQVRDWQPFEERRPDLAHGASRNEPRGIEALA